MTDEEDAMRGMDATGAGRGAGRGGSFRPGRVRCSSSSHDKGTDFDLRENVITPIGSPIYFTSPRF